MGTPMMFAGRGRSIQARDARYVDAVARDMLMFEEGKDLPLGRVRRLQRYLKVSEEAGAWDKLLARRAKARRLVGGG